MDIDKKLDLLKKIEKVEAPPFLITRIKQRIDTERSFAAPVNWKWGFAVIGLMLLALNISMVLRSRTSGSRQNMTSIVNSFHLSTDNNFYNE